MTPVEYIYYLGYRIDRLLRSSKRRPLSARTLSVGNLTIGGTGKTPLVIALAEEAVRRGLKTCILSRGYRSKGPESAIVSKGEGPMMNWEEAGDEPYMMAKRLNHVWIIKDRNRYRGSLIAGEVDLFILDDGFQHWPVERDLDIVTMDATLPFGNGRLLPLGPLREPLREVRRARIVLFTNSTGKNPAFEEQIRAHSPDISFFYSRYAARGLVGIDGELTEMEGHRGAKVYAVAGVGSPVRFLKSLKDEGFNITGETLFRDHHRYSRSDLSRIFRRAERSGSDIIITTEKDLPKIASILTDEPSIPVYAMRVDMVIEDPVFFDIALGKEDREV
ncbi:MAG: tetraacyldisaccharide 4'-kinase [Nitrospirae bacterium]|nr:MAG: tetraacyldisaccharide 4'-kinase [Nitrospirota bacterium]